MFGNIESGKQSLTAETKMVEAMKIVAGMERKWEEQPTKTGSRTDDKNKKAADKNSKKTADKKSEKMVDKNSKKIADRNQEKMANK